MEIKCLCENLIRKLKKQDHWWEITVIDNVCESLNKIGHQTSIGKYLQINILHTMKFYVCTGKEISILNIIHSIWKFSSHS